MYEQPPPYTGIGPERQNPPPPGWNVDGGQQAQGQSQFGRSAYPPTTATMAPYPAAPPSYDQATGLPQKVHTD